MQFAPDNTVQILADFVTTGAIEIRMNLVTPDDLVQEDGSVLRLNQDAAAKLLLETDQ